MGYLGFFLVSESGPGGDDEVGKVEGPRGVREAGGSGVYSEGS